MLAQLVGDGADVRGALDRRQALPGRLRGARGSLLGGEGIVQGSRVEFLFRLLRMYRVLTGTSEIQRNTIARELLAPPEATARART